MHFLDLSWLQQLSSSATYRRSVPHGQEGSHALGTLTPWTPCSPWMSWGRKS